MGSAITAVKEKVVLVIKKAVSYLEYFTDRAVDTPKKAIEFCESKLKVKYLYAFSLIDQIVSRRLVFIVFINLVYSIYNCDNLNIHS